MSEMLSLTDEDASALRPINQMVTVRLEDDHWLEETPGGIYIPEMYRDRYRNFQATVVKVGPGARRPVKWDGLYRPVKWGPFEKPAVKPGDKVIVTKWAAQTGGRSVYLNRRYMLVDYFWETLLMIEPGEIST